jgi:hypothetical protein
LRPPGKLPRDSGRDHFLCGVLLGCSIDAGTLAWPRGGGFGGNFAGPLADCGDSDTCSVVTDCSGGTDGDALLDAGVGARLTQHERFMARYPPFMASSKLRNPSKSLSNRVAFEDRLWLASIPEDDEFFEDASAAVLQRRVAV